jgi:two-component system, OmpR family, response regulator
MQPTNSLLTGDPGPFRVLYVDDNHDIADSTVDLLRLIGFDAKACYDGESALREATVYLPSVFFIDLTMPGMDGDELALRLQKVCNWHQKLFVAVTAMTNDKAQDRIKAAGFHLYLVKPVGPYKIVSVVDALCRLGTPEAAVNEIVSSH